ncbi:hypothetical protein A7982_12713 [Minicystis rosea]|nr:hypothetical protein A7982_12713 [Minicystis rosea]
MSLPRIPPLVPAGATFTFGESPFRAKGVLYLGTQSFFDTNLLGGTEKLVADIAEPERRAFITQKFLPSGWYDVMPVPGLIAYEARALRMTLDQYLVHRTRWQAKKDLGGVYGWVLKLASPAAVATRLPKVFSQMFDFATAPPGVVTGKQVTATMGGVPAPLEAWLSTAIKIYAETGLRLAGASHVDMHLRAVPAGERAGVPLVNLDVEVGWG